MEHLLAVGARKGSVPSMPAASAMQVGCLLSRFHALSLALPSAQLQEAPLPPAHLTAQAGVPRANPNQSSQLPAATFHSHEGA